MKTLTINIAKLHSFADIITNSSTQVFMYADKSTKDKITGLVNALFAIAGSSLTFDDVFDISYDTEDIEEWAADCYWDEDEATSAKKLEDLKVEVQKDDFKLPEDLDTDGTGITNRYIAVACKLESDNPNYNIATTALSQLHRIFRVDAY